MREARTQGEVWPSPISAAQAAEASLRHSEIAAARGRAIWVEARPSEQGRGVIAAAGATGGPADLLAPPFSARTRVHEYGGGALLGDGAAIFFVNHADQDIWELPPAGEPVRLTVAGDTRFADMARDTLRERLVAVAERHGENGQVENFIAAIGLEGQARGKPQELVRGADFYARPRVSPDGRWLSWLEWSLPDMPAGALGYLYWPGFLVLSAASIVTAPLGARVAHSIDVAPLKRLFALVLYALATYFILR